MKYNLSYDIAALLITIAVMLHFYVKKNLSTVRTKLFSLLIFVAFWSDILDIITAYYQDEAARFPMWLNYGMNEVYLLLFNMAAAVYFWYIMFSTKRKQELTLWNHICMLIPIAVDAELILTTGFTQKIIYFDEQGVYRHGSMMIVLYINAVLYVGMSLVHAFLYRRRMTVAQRCSVYAYTVLNLASTVLQIFVPAVLIIQFTVAISILLIYLSLENPSDYQDKKLGVFNRDAFVEVVETYIEMKKQFHIIGVQIGGFTYINDTIGVANGDRLLRMLADYLRSIDKNVRVFHISGIRFALVWTHNDLEAKDITAQIEERFHQPFKVNGVNISLYSQMCSLNYPKQVKKLEDIIDTIEYLLKELHNADEDHLVFASEEILRVKRRENLIIQIMSRAVRNHGFEVYYQPIYSVEKQRYVSAEALVRLHDDEMGFISPEEFIPIAEQNGMILEIGEIVFEEVCRFISLRHPEELGIEYIEVNLSVVQCMQEKMSRKLIQLMSLYHVPEHMINLEITETSAIISSDILQNNMQRLVDEGSTFALDDYGTGFSNMTHIIELPFSIIKLDKSMVWAALESDKARYALQYTAEMIKAMNMHIVAEGVETLEQAQMLESYGCDFFQGYYFSKPVPQDEFMQKLRAQSLLQ